MPPEIKSGEAETSQRARRPGQGEVAGDSFVVLPGDEPQAVAHHMVVPVTVDYLNTIFSILSVKRSVAM